MSSYSQRIREYCDHVVSNTLPGRKCCRLEKLACLRHLKDLERQWDDEYPYYFNEDSANRRCAFTEFLQHTKGKWRGQQISLEPHQLFIQGVMFGWLKKSDGKRRFTKSYCELTRKSGKSIEAATTGLFMAFADGEQSAEVYAGATTEAQAMMVFAPAYLMVKMNEAFAEYYGVQMTGTPKNPTSVYNIEDMSKFIPVVGNPGDGQSPHCAIIDEYHEHPTSVLYDAMDTGMGAREQPMLIVITTAGVNTSFPCYDLHLEAKKVLEGVVENDRLFCVIFTMDDGDDWRDFEVWKKVNPNYGVSIDQDYLFGKFQDAMNKPNQRNILLTKHLNVWQNAGVGFIDMLRWNKCEDKTLSMGDFVGKECWVGLDLASKIDLAALVVLFRYKRKVINETCPKCFGSVKVINGENKCLAEPNAEGLSCGWSKPVVRDCVVAFARHYLPEETAHKKENQHYQKWEATGDLIVTEGARTDFQHIENDLQELSKDFVVKELTFDPKEASYLIQNIQEWCSFECVEFEQGPATISQPMKELEAMVYANEFWHSGDPVFTWCMGNVVKKKSRSGGGVKHYFPTKENPELKIDSAVAAICALGRMMTFEDDGGGAYESRTTSGADSILRVL